MDVLFSLLKFDRKLFFDSLEIDGRGGVFERRSYKLDKAWVFGALNKMEQLRLLALEPADLPCLRWRNGNDNIEKLEQV